MEQVKGMDNSKAHAAGVATLLSVGVAFMGLGEMPSDDTITNAIILLGTGMASYVAGFVITWLKKSYKVGG